MDYDLAIDGAPETVPGGTVFLLLHPSIGETDRVDTDFLQGETDHFLVVSTRTTAREVEQKLEYYEVDESKAVILDALSVERGYSRRSTPNIHYVSGPDDVAGIVDKTREFLDANEGGNLRISVDSITEMVYYADEERALEATRQLVELVRDHDAVALFHLSSEVHDDAIIEQFTALFDGIVHLGEDGAVTYEGRN